VSGTLVVESKAYGGFGSAPQSSEKYGMFLLYGKQVALDPTLIALIQDYLTRRTGQEHGIRDSTDHTSETSSGREHEG
jgi:hypothetical protein